MHKDIKFTYLHLLGPFSETEIKLLLHFVYNEFAKIWTELH